MKRTNFLAIAALAAVVTLTSCSKDEEENDGRVRFTSAIAVQQNDAVSRAAGNVWANGDAIGIYMVNNASIPPVVSMSAANMKYTTNGNGTFAAAAAGSAIYYPQSGGAVDFIAYYPYKTTLAADVYSVNVVDQSDQTKIDLMWAKATGAAGAGYTKTNTGTVDLGFSHKLAKLKLNIEAGAGMGDLKGTVISIIGMNTTNTFNVMTGALGATPGSPATIAPKTTKDGENYEAILLPCTVTAADNVTVEFTVSGDKFVWKVPATEFEAGKEHTWVITIARTGVGVTASITDWVTGPVGTGTAN